MFLLYQAPQCWAIVYMPMLFWRGGGLETKRLEHRTLHMLSKPVLLWEVPVASEQSEWLLWFLMALNKMFRTAKLCAPAHRQYTWKWPHAWTHAILLGKHDLPDFYRVTQLEGRWFLIYPSSTHCLPSPIPQIHCCFASSCNTMRQKPWNPL